MLRWRISTSVIVSALLAVLVYIGRSWPAGEVASAQIPQAPLLSYAAKFICGSHLETMPQVNVLLGDYATKINIHNNSGGEVTFRKKVISLRPGQERTRPQSRQQERLSVDEAMEVACSDILDSLNISMPAREVVEGFVIIEVLDVELLGIAPEIISLSCVPPIAAGVQAVVSDPLDVVGVYTYRDDRREIGRGIGASLDVERAPCKVGDRRTLFQG